VAVSFILRITLLFHPITDTTFIWTDEIKIFIFGLFSDVLSLYSPVSVAVFNFHIKRKYLKPYGYIIFGLFVALFLYIASGKSILNEYGGALPKIGLAFVGIKTFIWTSTFLPKQRDKIRYWLFAFVMFLFVVLILQNAISEYFLE
jgi:hypothetical protein